MLYSSFIPLQIRIGVQLTILLPVEIAFVTPMLRRADIALVRSVVECGMEILLALVQAAAGFRLRSSSACFAGQASSN